VVVYEFNSSSGQWEMIGYELFGSEAGDRFGFSVALSTTGEYLVVGSPYCTAEEGQKKEAGCVKVYEKNNVLGNDINDMVYEPMGYTIFGENAYDHFGFDVDIHEIIDEENAREIVQIAVGAPDALDTSFGGSTSRVGKAYFYEFDLRDDNGGTEQWKGYFNVDGGMYISKGDKAGSKFGSSVSLTLDNQLVAVGAPGDNNGAGSVSLFKLHAEKWSKVGGFVAQGSRPGEGCGASVSITLRGDYVAYGCPTATRSNPDMLEVGKVQVQKLEYEFNNATDSWTWTSELVVKDIWGEAEGDLSGSSIDIGVHSGKENSNTGFDNLFLAVGAPNNYPDFETKQKAGHVRVWHLKNGDTWMKANLDIDGDEAFDELGTSVSISYDGTRVAAGAPGGDGYAKVYQLSDTLPPTYAPTPSPTPPPTEHHERKPTEEGGIGKTRGGGQGRSVWLTFLFLVIVPGTIFMVFRMFVYWKARRDYDSNFQSGNNISQPLPNNDLELTVTSTGIGSHTNTNQAAGARDII